MSEHVHPTGQDDEARTGSFEAEATPTQQELTGDVTRAAGAVAVLAAEGSDVAEKHDSAGLVVQPVESQSRPIKQGRRYTVQLVDSPYVSQIARVKQETRLGLRPRKS